MHRVIARLAVIAVCLCLMIPTLSTFAAGKAFIEGFHLDSNETHHQSLHITIDATKRIDGKSRQSEIHISYHYNYVDGSRDFDATINLGGDADQLEVSRDLGWGGLDTIIYVQQRRVDCTFNPDRVCGPEIIENIPVELHLSLSASDGLRQEGGLFKRNANASSSISGTIKTPNLLTTLNFGQGMFSGGNIFSDQAPR